MSSAYSSPELDDTGTKANSTTRESEGDDGSVFSDDSLRSPSRRSRRNSVESLSKLRRYRTSKWRSSAESLASETDSQAESRFANEVIVYKASHNF